MAFALRQTAGIPQLGHAGSFCSMQGTFVGPDTTEH